jgi:hypothetical protein
MTITFGLEKKEEEEEEMSVWKSGTDKSERERVSGQSRLVLTEKKPVAGRRGKRVRSLLFASSVYTQKGVCLQSSQSDPTEQGVEAPIQEYIVAG